MGGAAGRARCPPEIVAGAPADPWTFDSHQFAAPDVAADTPSRAAAAALLGDGGTVLDRRPDMLARCTSAAVARGVPCRPVPGSWPDVTGSATSATLSWVRGAGAA